MAFPRVRNCAFVVLVLLHNLAVSLAIAQQPVVLRIDQVDTSQFPAIAIVVTARNAYGGPIPDLGPDNFAVSEDDTLTPRPIQAVTPLANPDVPVTVVMAVDVSGSMSGAKLRDAQEAAQRFLDGLGQADRVALIAFANTIDLAGADPAREHDFSQDKATLYAVIDALKAGGATPLYDTAYKAVQWAAAQPAGNRAVLLFTDGKEEKAQDGRGGSQVANDDAPILEANKQGVPVFTIGLGEDADESYLQRLAIETGGTYQHAKNSAELAQLFRNVSDLLKQQYRIDYTSGAPADGGEHSVRVMLTHDEYEDSGQASMGKVPLIATSPAAEPTNTPVEPTSAPSPAATPVAALPTATSKPDLVAKAAGNGDSPAQSGPLGIDPLWWLLIAAGVLALGALGVFILASMGVIARGRKNREAPGGGAYHCLRCGATLPAKNARCPSCGALQSYKEGM